MQNNQNPILNIIQITDTHVFSDSQQTVFDVNTTQQFHHAIEQIKRDPKQPDLIFLTGDIAHDETREAYQMVAETLSSLGRPIYWIPGNHDNPSFMSEVFDQYFLFHKEKVFHFDAWTFIFINTKYGASDAGYFNDTDKDVIEAEMTHCDSQHNVCIVMHHNPIAVGTPLMDQTMIQNNEEFWRCIKQYDQIKHIICGHVHNSYRICHDGVTIESSLATCFQIPKGATELDIAFNIGYKRHAVFDNQITSHSINIENIVC